MNKVKNIVANISDIFFQFQAKLQFFEREYLRKYQIEDVTPSEVKVLYIIGISNTKSMSEIANELKITRGTLSITVDSLVKKGYVIRNRHKQDRRIIILYLSQKAIRIVKHYGRFFESLFISLAKRIKRDKLHVFDEVMERLNEIVESNFYEGVQDYPELLEDDEEYISLNDIEKELE
jgi:DNA-binding MarR family transcriptional regulator